MIVHDNTRHFELARKAAELNKTLDLYAETMKLRLEGNDKLADITSEIKSNLEHFNTMMTWTYFMEDVFVLLEYGVLKHDATEKKYFFTEYRDEEENHLFRFESPRFSDQKHKFRAGEGAFLFKHNVQDKHWNKGSIKDFFLPLRKSKKAISEEIVLAHEQLLVSQTIRHEYVKLSSDVSQLSLLVDDLVSDLKTEREKMIQKVHASDTRYQKMIERIKKFNTSSWFQRLFSKY